MKRTSTKSKFVTKLTQFSWLGALIIAALIFTRCYEWTSIDQPSTAAPNSSFDVKITLKQDAEAIEAGDFAYDLYDLGVFGVQLPEGWTIENDSFYYSIKGVLQNDVMPYEYEGYITYDQTYATMYEDSIPSDDGYYWWGGVSDSAHVDNLDSIYVELTILTDDQLGTFNLQYGMGTMDWPEGRMPVAEGGLSPKVPITIEVPSNVKRYLKKQVSVYPNPASEIMNVDVGEVESGKLQLFNIAGQLQYDVAISDQLNMIDVSSFAPGSYFLKVSTEKGAYSKKVLVK
jgi:hypothetical protein